MAHDALLCVQTNAKIHEENRFRFHGDQHYLKSAVEMRSLFDEVPEACDSTLWIAERGGRRARVRQPGAAELPGARGPHREDVPARAHDRGRQGALRPVAARGGPRTARARARRHRVDGVLRVLPHRLGHRPLREVARASGSVPAGERGGLVRRVLPAHRRHRPDQVRPAVRAVPQPGPQADARHRHGLRLPLPRRDDQVRLAALRRGPRRADRHVLHDQGASRGARRGAGARLPVRARRQDRQAHAAADHGPRHPAQRVLREAPEVRGRLQDGRRPPGVLRVGPGRQAGHRRGQGPRRAAPPGRHPRRRGRDHPGAADRVPPGPAQARARRHDRGRARRHPVRDARGRGPRPAEDGLPRPAQPRRHRDHPRARRAVHRRAARHRQRPARRPEDLRAAARRRHDRRVPARGRADARADPVGRAGQLRGRLRGDRALPPGADGPELAQRVRGPQERAQADHVPAPGARGAARTDLRVDGVPGAADAPEPAARRVLARGRREPAQGDRQEDPRAHREGALEVRRRLRRAGPRARVR